MIHSSSVLVWPARRLSLEAPGYIIGWEDIEEEEGCWKLKDTASSSAVDADADADFDHQNATSTLSPSSTSIRTTICAGIISLPLIVPSRSTTPVATGSNKTTTTTSHQEEMDDDDEQQQQQDNARMFLTEILQHWTNGFRCYGKTNNETERNSDGKCTVCASCVCHKQLRIVGLWDPNPNHAPIATSPNQKKCPMRGGSDALLSSSLLQVLPRIVPTARGPWWAESDLNHPSRPPSLFAKQQQQQLLMYDPCGVNGLAHYRQAFAWSHKASSLLNMCCVLGFQRTLLRLSEAEELFASIQRLALSSLSLHTLSFDNNNNTNVSICNIDSSSNTTETQVTHDGLSTRSQGENISSRRASTAAVLSKPPPNTAVHAVATTLTGKDRFLRKVTLFIRRNSLLALHWDQERLYQRGCLESIVPLSCFFQLVFLLVVRRESSFLRPSTKKQLQFQPRQLAAHLTIAHLDRLAAGALDGLLGLLLGTFLLFHIPSVRTVLQLVWTLFHTNLRDNIAWLETFPVGFKLNVPLTQTMGREISMLVNMHDFVSSLLLSMPMSGWSWWGGGSSSNCTDNTSAMHRQYANECSSLEHWLLVAIGCIGIAFGFLAMLAMVFDCIRIVTIHIHCFATMFRNMHQGQLYLISSLWRLFRGKKTNILRQHRTDTMEYDSMQLLLGIVLFTSVLFLFTTILVYYSFFAAMHLAIYTCCALLWILYISVRYFPLGTCLVRIRKPNWFTRNVFLRDLSLTKPTTIDELPKNPIPSTFAASAHALAVAENRSLSKLETVPQSFSEIISQALLSSYLAILLSYVPSFVGEAIAGKPCTVLRVCLDCIGSGSSTGPSLRSKEMHVREIGTGDSKEKIN